MTRLVWMIGQALAIGGLTYAFINAPLSPGEKPPGPAILFINIIIVAFGTALIVNTADWFRRTFRYAATPAWKAAFLLAIFGPAIGILYIRGVPSDPWAIIGVPIALLIVIGLSCGVVNLSLRAWTWLNRNLKWAAEDRNAPGALDREAR